MELEFIIQIYNLYLNKRLINKYNNKNMCNLMEDKMSVESIIKQNVNKVSEKVYIAPDIPEKKLNNAIISITENKEDPDVIIAVIDTTAIMNNAKNGFIFTGNSFYFRNLWEKPIQIKYENIKSAKIKTKLIKNEDGTGKETKTIFIEDYEGNVLFENTVSLINQEEFVNLINQIITKVKNENGIFSYENSSQYTPLSDCDSSVKLAYIKLICNFALSDDGIVDSREYSEIYSLLVRNDFNYKERICIRAYITNNMGKNPNEDLISIMKEKVPEGSFDVLTKSIIKDLIYINYKKGNSLDSWGKNEFITALAQQLNVSAEQISFMIQNIQNDEDIIAKRKSNTEIQKSINDLVAKAGAIGVPIAAVYFSGSVVGLSAAGITSGLATLGMGGILGFSSMVTGIGTAIIISFITYNKLKKITGTKDLEENKTRELLIQNAIKNLQKTINYLIEDVNYISSELLQCIENQNKDEEKIIKLKKLLQIFIDASNNSSQRLLTNAKEAIIVKLPAKLNKIKFDELTSEPTKQKLRPFVYEMYIKTIENTKEGESQKIEYYLDDSKETGYYERLYQIFDVIKYFELAATAKAYGNKFRKDALNKLSEIMEEN